jgi:hypothetical protein
VTEEERIAIGELADDLQVRKQRIFKILPRLGISNLSLSTTLDASRWASRWISTADSRSIDALRRCSVRRVLAL